MQPALVSLLTNAVVHNPKSGFDRNGDPVLFHRPGEFPSASDPEFEVASEARIVYKTGELPVVLKSLAPRAYSLGMPFSYLSFVNTHWTTLVGMLGILALMLPLTRAVPALYVWTVRRRMVYWYKQLKALERNLDSGAPISIRACCRPSSTASTATFGGCVCRATIPATSMTCAGTSIWCAREWR